MLKAFVQSVGPALMPRLLLLANHLLAAEPVAVERLRAHAGRCIQLQLRDLPAVLSWWPATVMVQVTPAGLLDVPQPDGNASAPSADLVVTIDASNPTQTFADAVTGQMPLVDVAGDAALAADVSWLIDHVRWDVQDDLARLVGEGPAHQLVRSGSAVAAALRRAVQALVQKAADLRRSPSASAPMNTPPR